MQTRSTHSPSMQQAFLCGMALLGLLGAVVTSGAGQRSVSGSPLLPNARLTPGDVLAVTTADVCKPGYSKLVRDVPEAVKLQAYANYSISHHSKGEFEVDHLISLELGGSNSIKNLWPQSYQTQPWNARVKDKLENELHRLVCKGSVTMATAQHDIATDWIAAYKKYFHTSLPPASSHKSTAALPSNPSGSSKKPSLFAKLIGTPKQKGLGKPVFRSLLPAWVTLLWEN